MTPEEHLAEAKNLLRHAVNTYNDNSDEPAPRENYPTEEEYLHQAETFLELREKDLAEASALAQLAQAHAAIATAITTTKETTR